MSEQERQLALDINALLMAFHNEDLRTLKSIINDNDEPVDLMLGSIAVLINMVEELIEVLDVNVDEVVNLDFESLIRMRGQAIADEEFGDD